MIRWMAERIWWFTWRTAVTLACLWTIQNAIHLEGYYIEFRTLLVAGVCAIVGLRFWMPTSETSSKRDKE